MLKIVGHVTPAITLLTYQKHIKLSLQRTIIFILIETKEQGKGVTKTPLMCETLLFKDEHKAVRK